MRVHVVGAGPVGLMFTALLQPVEGLSVRLYEKRREYTRTRMVQLAPFLEQFADPDSPLGRRSRRESSSFRQSACRPESDRVRRPGGRESLRWRAGGRRAE